MDDHEMIAEILLNAARQIGLFSIEQLEAHVERSKQSIESAHSVGYILDPTGYRNAMYNGSLKKAEIQLKIATKLLEIRILMEAHDDITKGVK